MEYKILYRIEHPENFGGAWYNEDGSDNRIVDELTNSTLSELPMGRDERYHADGKKWQCAAWSVDHLKYWFTEDDAQELILKGFKLCKFISTQFIFEEQQVLFTKLGVISLEYFDSYEALLESEVNETVG